jgi:thiol:disulfide interchange protein DsbC
MKSLASLLAILWLVAAPFALSADEPLAKNDPRVQLAAKIPGTKPEDLSPSPIPGIYEMRQGADIAYVSADGRYAISGDLYDIRSKVNLTESTRRAARLKLMAGLSESQMVVFSPANPKYTVTVFTDIDCPYCRKLHSQIADYNRLGIKVRYLFYPRSGPDTESWAKAEQVWCAKDRNDAFTRLKRGEKLDSARTCKGSPVAQQYALGQKLAIGGTPAIILEDGVLLAGYLPPAMLAQRLKGG